MRLCRTKPRKLLPPDWDQRLWGSGVTRRMNGRVMTNKCRRMDAGRRQLLRWRGGGVVRGRDECAEEMTACLL